MFLIAVDEAGYGPKLGPLVVAATSWLGPADQSRWNESDALIWDVMKQPVAVDGQRIVVDDSKKVFASRTKRRGDTSPLGNLHRVLSLAHHAMGRTESDWAGRLPSLIPDDIGDVAATPWLALMLDGEAWPKTLPRDWLPASSLTSAINAWSVSPWRLADARARLITAKAFNAFCDPARCPGAPANKSDLLGEASLGLVAEMLSDPMLKDHDSGVVFFDRHGGRRYYAAILSAIIPDADVRVVSETSRCSVYDVATPRFALRVHFTVQGDSFVPVAMSSLHAKCLREIAMTFLNDHFQSKWTGEQPLVPTAGYPVDADRFLNAIETILDAQSIHPTDLVRCR